MNNKKSSPMKYLVLITVAIALLLAIIVVLLNQDKDIDQTLESHPPTENQPMIGEEGAPVSVVEFGDFKCPACKAWGEMIYPKLKADFIDTEKANFAYINTEFHGKESTLGALAAEFIWDNDPDSYWKFHKKLFEEQPGDDHHALWITVEKLAEVAEDTTNVDIDQLVRALEQQTFMEEVNSDSSIVQEFNIQKTPTIIINGTMLEDPYDYEKIKSLIEKGQE
ncbi:thioredoxin domain-containing protein [Bacillus sp. AK031]